MIEVQAKLEIEQQRLPLEMEKLQSEIALNLARAEDLKNQHVIEKYKSEMDLTAKILQIKSKSLEPGGNIFETEEPKEESYPPDLVNIAKEEMKQGNEPRDTGGMAIPPTNIGPAQAPGTEENRPAEPIRPPGDSGQDSF